MTKRMWAATRLVLTLALVLAGILGFTVPAWAETARTVSVSDASETAYPLDGRLVLTGTATGDTLADVSWASDDARDAVCGVIRSHEAGWSGDAQDAAEWLSGHMDAALSREVAAAVSGLPVGLVARQGSASTVPEQGWWCLTDGRGRTAPVLAVLGGRDVAITEKGAPPTVSKTVDGATSEAAWVGKVQHYAVTGTMPGDLADWPTYSYVMHDRADEGLEIDPSTVRVTLAGTDVTREAHVTATARSVDVTFDDIRALTTDPTAVVELDYDATVTTGPAGNAHPLANECWVTHREGETEHHTTRTYVTSLDVRKVSSGTGRALAGATLSVTRSSDGRHFDGTSWVTGDVTCVTGADGIVHVTGVGPGDVTVTEVAAPAGYQVARGSATVHVNATADGSGLALSPKLEATSDAWSLDATDAATGLVTMTLADEPTRTPPSQRTPPVRDLWHTGGGVAAMALMAGGAIATSLAALSRRKRRDDGI